MECSSDFLDPGDKRKAAQSRTATADSKRQYRGFSPDGTTGSALLDRNELEVAKVLLNTVVRNPHLLHDPDLKFVKSFLQHFGATIPSQQELESPHALADESGHDSSVDLDGEEFSEDDFLEEGYDDKLIPPETVPPPPRGAHPRLESEYSEEETLRAAEYRALAKSSYEAGDLNAAIENLTVALQLHPSALLYARRAEALLAQLRPNAALVDCNVALEINPESAKVRTLTTGACEPLHPAHCAGPQQPPCRCFKCRTVAAVFTL